MKFKSIKEEIRIVAWDDGPFKFGSKGKDILVGAIYRGGKYLDGVLKTEIDIDGEDATRKIIDKMKETRHKDVRVIMLDGITFAGFNTVDIKEVSEGTGLPVIVVCREKPDIEKFKESLKKLQNYEKRLQATNNAGPLYEANVKDKKVYFQMHGMERSDAERIIASTSTMSLIPEPLRAAHLIATGMVLGESVGRA